MSEENLVVKDLVVSVPKLTLGTFFTLFYSAVKKHPVRPNQGEFLFDLIRVFLPKDINPGPNTLKTEASQYKNCSLSSSTWIPLGNKEFIKRINDSYDNDFANGIKRMSAFIHKYFDLDDDYKIKRASMALIDVIVNDKTISKTALFYIKGFKNGIQNQELLKQEDYKYEHLIYGVSLYILTHDEIVNEDGAATLFEWESKNNVTSSVQYFYEIDEENPVLQISFSPLSEKDLNIEIIDKGEEPFVVPEKTLLYVDFVANKYQNVTPIFQFEPRPFYSQYVNNSIKIEENFFHGQIIVENPTAPTLKTSVSNYIILVGDGGLGKTMMIHHLAYDSAIHFREYKLIPFVINLKNYNDGEKDLELFIVNEVMKCFAFTQEEIKTIFIEGNALFLLDGLDEIYRRYISTFQRSLEAFKDKYKNNIFVISSRGYGNFETYRDFTTIKLCPLSLPQAVELVGKIEPNEELRNRFINRLKDGLYKSHEQFASNPMMLTILLRTFKNYPNIPVRLDSFFQKAFETLAAKHDADKEQFKRNLVTDLTPDEFRELLTRLCTKIYFSNLKQFSKEQFIQFLNQVKEIAKMDKVKADDFLEDLKVSFCLVSEEKDMYSFNNEAFMEYFVASQLIKFSEKQLQGVVNFLNTNRSPLDDDKMLEMLYEMDRIGTEEKLFLPYLDGIFKECDEDEDPYMTFLSIIYPTISYTIGDVVKEKNPCSSSFVYNFIRKVAGLDKPAEVGDYVEQDLELEFSSGEYYETLNEDMPIVGPCNISNKDEFDPNELPQPCGWDIDLVVRDLLNERSKYEPLIEEMSADYDPLHEEYEAIRKYYESLKKQKEAKPNDFDSLLY